MNHITRRAAMEAVGGSFSLAALGGTAGANTMSTKPRAQAAPVFAHIYEPKALPFDARTLDGLSEKLIKSHWENNYLGSVKALNMIRSRLADAMSDAELPPVVYGGLKREELHRLGSVILHERYFGNLGGDGKPKGAIASALASHYGSLKAWQSEFERTALSLAGGSGWCVLAFNLHTQSLHNYWAWDHMHNTAASIPLLVLDMYEHAFHIDYGAAAAKYVAAFLRNVNWEEVDRRHGRAVTMGAL
jgi:Fe-Mn family superoxide dismutase